MANLSIYSLGSRGVNADKDPVHLDDGELTSAQNTIKDPLGVLGGVTKRLGLSQFNGSAAAGTIVGGIGVPLLHPTVRTLYLGTENQSAGTGWHVSTTAFTTAATESTTPAVPLSSAKTTTFDSGYGSVRGITPGISAFLYKSAIYYAADTYSQGTDRPPIRYYDGTFDREIAKVPINTDVGTVSQAIMQMIVANGTAYISTYDTGTPDPIGHVLTFKGKVYQFDPSSGVFTPIGATFPTGYLPYCLTYANGFLWCGTISQDPTLGGRVYFIRPGVDTAWTLDHTFAAGNDVCCIVGFRGNLYVGVEAFSTNAFVAQRTSLGVWSTVETGTGTAEDNNYNGGIVFNNALYIAYNDGTAPDLAHAKIRKFDGTTWSTAFTEASGQQNYSFSFIDNGVLYFLSPRDAQNGGIILVSTPDGTTWTDRTSALNSKQASPAFGVLLS